MNISLQFLFHNFYLMFPICDKKDFENFLILSMIVIFALTILSRSIKVVLALVYDTSIKEIGTDHA